MKIIFIAAPYGDSSGYLAIEENIQRARRAAAELADHGYGYYCPHLNSAHFEAATPNVRTDFWYEMDRVILERACDAMLVLAESPGVLGEIEQAKALGIPVCRSLAELGKALPDA